MAAPKEIIDLVDHFDRSREAYESDGYNETQLRREFVDPFFNALGWDVDNTAGYAEIYKDVIHEDAIKIGGATKAPDYSFRVGGMRKFFVETKRPSVNISDDPSPSYQLRRYAWSAKLPLSILTNFEELAVYDCTVKPKITDKASTARIMQFNYRRFEKTWEEISSIFSKDAVLKGSFDRYAKSARRKKGTAGVDAAFLSDIDAWRQSLAQIIALRNPKLTQRELNFAVGKTIDRIIFLRICEDRGIEPNAQLMALQNGTNIYQRLIQIYYKADDKYNSGLFHFRKEKDRYEPPDDLTLNLTIDDKPLKEIFKSLYYPESPYEFSVLPADILGQIYEQFLGKIIYLTPGHRAKVEEKPEVKKAGGVYYTPTYIVNHIVKNTVGKLLEGKKPGPRGNASNLRILDPACGSGSFLIGAYQYLLDWQRDRYIEDSPEKWAKGRNAALCQVLRGEWRLTTAERKRILLNNIYGVDIDPQAVEVTKLSLLLKVLEGENEQTLANQMRLFHERALPDLGSNIKCGNSLIGSDFYDNQQLSFFDDEERYRINVFDWEKEFPEIFKEGGFDAVIGNPPYVRIQALKEWAPLEVEFYKTCYTSASKGNYDIYVIFVEKGLSLLNIKGRLGFILPHKFFNAQYGEPLRSLLSNGNHISDIIHFGDRQVFAGATTYTCLLFLDKAGTKSVQFKKVEDLDLWRSNGKGTEGKIPSSTITSSEWNFTVGRGAALLEKLKQMPVKLEHVTSRIFQGIKTSADKIYILDELEREPKRVKIYSRQKEAIYWLEPDLLHPLIKGGDSTRYFLSRTNRLILFPYEKRGEGVSQLIPNKTFEKHYPLSWQYLLDNKAYLENRESGKMKGQSWYGYGRIQALDVMPLPKIFTPDIAARSSFSLDETGDVFFTGGVAGGYGILVLAEYSREYVLGLLNSRLLEWFIYQTATQMRGGYYSYESRFIHNMPIRTINFSDPADKARHKLMVALVEQMLSLNKKLATAKTDHDKTTMQRQIDATDHQIDKLVYELYGLTDEEIGIVEDDASGGRIE
jgi:hypothetical protein